MHLSHRIRIDPTPEQCNAAQAAAVCAAIDFALARTPR